MFVDHQSTSGTKIHNLNACTRAVVPNYVSTEITELIVIVRIKIGKMNMYHVGIVL